MNYYRIFYKLKMYINVKSYLKTYNFEYDDKMNFNTMKESIRKLFGIHIDGDFMILNFKNKIITEENYDIYKDTYQYGFKVIEKYSNKYLY